MGKFRSLCHGELARRVLSVIAEVIVMAQRKYAHAEAPEGATSTRAPSAPTKSGTHRKVEVPRTLVREVLEHPHAVLARRATEVDPGEPLVVAIANLLVATMRMSPACVGLAAPQIGESVRVFAMNVTGHKKARSCAGLVVLANPRILERDGNVMMREGCMSVPHLTGDVARAERVTLSGSVPGTGRNVIIHADGIEARCIQHEIDHLDGALFVDRVLDPVAELFARRRYA